jgi:uncharacterized protein YndB with AHSA1/START domain
MSTTTADTSVRLEITVDAPAERAFDVFTQQFDQIKPREHNMLGVPIVETIFETHVGGNVYDRGEDGSECRWARVLVFEPPHRFVISWDISLAWQVENNLDRTSEVEVRFVPVDDGHTRVELEHRNLDRHGDGWPSMRGAVGGDGGWPEYLRRYVAALAA